MRVTSPSVQFAALSDSIKFFNGLDHSLPPQTIFANLSARVTFQLGPQPIDSHAYSTWHSRCMSLLYWSLTCTASNWYDRFPQIYKDDWPSFLQILKKHFFSQKEAYYAQLETLALTGKDDETIRQLAFEVEALVKQVWCNEVPSTINLECC